MDDEPGPLVLVVGPAFAARLRGLALGRVALTYDGRELPVREITVQLHGDDDVLVAPPAPRFLDPFLGMVECTAKLTKITNDLCDWIAGLEAPAETRPRHFQPTETKAQWRAAMKGKPHASGLRRHHARRRRRFSRHMPS